MKVIRKEEAPERSRGDRDAQYWMFPAAADVISVTWKSNEFTNEHRHEYVHEIVLVTTGYIEVRCGKKVVRLGPGDAAYLPPSRTFHATRVADRATFHFPYATGYCFKFIPSTAWPSIRRTRSVLARDKILRSR